jgi:peroxiredoxin
MKFIAFSLSVLVFFLVFSSCSPGYKSDPPISMDKPWKETIKFKLAAIHFFVYDPMDVKYKDFTLYDLNGKSISLSDFQGKPILLYFWSTLSSVSQDELPAIEKLYETLKKDGISVVSVDLGDPSNEVAEFVKKNKLSFTVLLDQQGALEKVYARIRVPTAYIIDPEGFLAAATAGQSNWNTPEMRIAFRILGKKLEWKK